MITLFSLGSAIKEGIFGLLLALDGIVYWLVGVLFELYVTIAGVDIINDNIYLEIANRFLVILGVVMLFYLAYALLKSLINPDDGIKNTSKIVMNLVISLILIAVVPTIFSLAFKVQNIIISDHVIDKVVFGNSTNSLTQIGRETAMNFFGAFVEVNDNAELGDYANWESLQACIVDPKIEGCSHNESFKDVSILSGPVVDGDADYTFFISTLCGGFLVYVIASFCIDLGIRVIKLAFYQIISPIPIMMRIIPEKKSVFDNWVKATLATYLEVFIRIFIIYMISFLCAKIFDSNSLNLKQNIGIIGTIIIVMGLWAFAKQAPKLISEMTGIDSGNMKLGIREKLANGGGLAAAAFMGSGVTSGVRNLTHGISNGINNFKQANGGWNKFKAVVGSTKQTVRSTAAGVVSGAVRGGKSGWKAKNFTDVKNAASEGAAATTEKRDKREAYKANHGNKFGSSMVGHARDVGSGLKTWMGVSTSLNNLKQQQSKAQSVSNAIKSVNDRLDKILEREKNQRITNLAVKVKNDNGQVYQYTDSSGKVRDVEFSNYADLQNEIKIMESTGKTSFGATVTPELLRAYNSAEFQLKKQMKEEILSGYKKDGSRMSKSDFATDYDGELKELLTKLRTESLNNADVIEKYSTDAAATALYKQAAVDNKAQKLDDFVLGNQANQLFTDSKKSINSANTEINIAVNKQIEKEQKKS